MKLKLDENLPSRAINVLRALGHDVETAVEEGLAGEDDPVLLAAATSEGRLLVTMDRGLGDIRAYPPGTHAGILVIRLISRREPWRAPSISWVPRLSLKPWPDASECFATATFGFDARPVGLTRARVRRRSDHHRREHRSQTPCVFLPIELPVSATEIADLDLTTCASATL